MTVVDITRHIREQLTAQIDSVDLLAAEDKEFLDLCNDFDDCVDAMHYWLSSEEPEAEIRIGEYRDLLGALYGEITEILKKTTRRRQE